MNLNPIWAVAFYISIHSFLYGYSMACLGSLFHGDAKGSIQNQVYFDDDWQQYATAITTFGAFLGCFICTNPLQKYGGKTVLRFNNMFWIIGGMFCFFDSKTSVMVGRFIIGIAMGVSSATAPVLLSEIAPDHIRGSVTAMAQLFITIGIFIACLACYVGVTHIGEGWRYVLALPAPIGFLMSFVDYLIPNSPVFLLRHRRAVEAKITLSYLRFGMDVTAPTDDDNSMARSPSQLAAETSSYRANDSKETKLVELDDEIHRLTQQINEEANYPPVTWAEVLTYKKALIIGFVGMFVQPMSGINAVTYYSTRIFGTAGVQEDILATVSVSLTNFLSTIVSLYTLEYFGRRSLLVVGTTVCACGLATLTFSLLALNHAAGLQSFLAIGSVLVYVAFFAQGLGSSLTVLLNDILPSRIRGKVFGLFVAESWILNLFIALFTVSSIKGLGGGSSDDQQKKGVAWLFLIFAIVCVVGVFFFVARVPETKGKSEEEINQIMRAEHSTDNFKLMPESEQAEGSIVESQA